MRTAALLTSSVLTLLMSAPASAQDLRTTPDSGARVRVWRSGEPQWKVGTLVRLAGDSLIFDPRFCCGLDTVQLRAIRELAVSRGLRRQPSRMILWAIWGGAVGAASGFVVTSLQCRSSGNELCALGVTRWVPALALAGGVLGGLIGSRKVEQWERIFPVNRAGLILIPNRDRGVAVGLALTVRE